MTANRVSPDSESLGPGKLPGAFLAQLLGGIASTDGDVVVGPGIGRDAAAVRIGDKILVLKSDPITFASRGAARYLVSVNGNDLACLGATPRWMLVTGMFPIGTTRQQISEVFSDLADVTTRDGIALIGGHTEITPAVNRPVLVGMMAGETTDERLIIPGRAQDGDVLVLSRPISIEGTALLADELEERLIPMVGFELIERAQALINSPGLSVTPDARIALDVGGIQALHDPTEGGIAMGVRELAEASGLSAQLHLDRVPIMPETRAIAKALGIDPLGMLASGSLLVALPKASARALLLAWKAAGAEPAIIGRLVDPTTPHRLIVGVDDRALPEFVQDEVARALAQFGD